MGILLSCSPCSFTLAAKRYTCTKTKTKILKKEENSYFKLLEWGFFHVNKGLHFAGFPTVIMLSLTCSSFACYTWLVNTYLWLVWATVDNKSSKVYASDTVHHMSYANTTIFPSITNHFLKHFTCFMDENPFAFDAEHLSHFVPRAQTEKQRL